jgi:hypothetical protein
MTNHMMGKINLINFIIASAVLVHIWASYIIVEIETSTIVRSFLTILLLLGLSKRSNLARWIYIILTGLALFASGSYLMQSFSISLFVMSIVYLSHVLILLFHKKTALEFADSAKA